MFPEWHIIQWKWGWKVDAAKYLHESTMQFKTAKTDTKIKSQWKWNNNEIVCSNLNNKLKLAVVLF